MKIISKILLLSISIILLLLQVYKYVTNDFPIKVFKNDKSFAYKFGYWVGYDFYLILGVILLVIAINIKSPKVV